MIRKITEPDRVSFYYKDSADKTYCRVLAGLSFPVSKPGFVVIIAEDYYKVPNTQCQHMHALAEAEESDTERLFKLCLDLRQRFSVEWIIGNMDNEPMMELLYQFNNGLDGAQPLNTYPASFPDDLSFHVHTIKSVSRSNSRILHLGECSALNERLSIITPEDVSGGKASDHPAVMALGYCISYIKDQPRDPFREQMRRMAQRREAESYDPLRRE